MKTATRQLLWFSLVFALCLPFLVFFRALAREWWTDPNFSFGALIPLISVFLLWIKRDELARLTPAPWLPGIGLVAAGCAVHVMGTLSGVLLVSGVGFITVLFGLSLFLWGKAHTKELALPLAFLIFMVPWPTYTIGSLTWHLQGMASSIAAVLLQLFRIPVFQDGNLLILPGYVLAVEEACSGVRSTFALLAIAALMAFLRGGGKPLFFHLPLIASAPLMASMGNIVRIVGTGLAAQAMGPAAAEDSLHTVWGILVFLIAVAGLVTMQKLLLWLNYRFASQS